MNESPYIDRWLRNRLISDTGAGGLFEPGTPGQGARVAGVYSEEIPEDAPLPAIRFSDQAPQDVLTGNGTRVLATGLYLIVVTGKTGDYGDIRLAADRLDDLLHRASGTLAPIIVLQSWREGAFRQPERVGDVNFRHLGGYYRVQAQS